MLKLKWLWVLIINSFVFAQEHLTENTLDHNNNNSNDHVYLNLSPKMCNGLFWNYLSTLLNKIDMDVFLNEADENILAFVKKLIQEKKEMLSYKPPTVYWYSRQG
jgi:hypothetical protein